MPKNKPAVILTTLPEFMEEARLTNQRLGDAVGLSAEMIRDYVNKNRTPTLESALRIAHYFDVPVNAMWDLQSRITEEANDKEK